MSSLADLFSWVVAGDPPCYFFSENFSIAVAIAAVLIGGATGYVWRMQDERRRSR